MSVRLLGTEFWKVARQLSSRAHGRSATIAYVTTDSHLRFGKGDLLITDASDGAIRSNQTSAPILEKAFRRGVKLFSHEELHAKVYLLGDHLLVGSANLTGNSAKLREAAVVTTDSGAITNAKRWLRQIEAESVPITASFLKRALALPVTRTGGRGSKLPTLLEALEQQLPILDDLVFGIYWDEAELLTKAVKGRAKRLKVPLPPNVDSWGWFEDTYTARVATKTEQLLGDRNMVTFEVTQDDSLITTFEELDDELSTYLTGIRMGNRLVTIVDLRKRPPLRLSGPDASLLCRRLSRGLKKSPNIARRMRASTGSFVEVKDLITLLALGSSPNSA